MGFLNNFWDFVWMFLTIFVFIVYLFAIFAIIGDLFRDHKMSGWAKALWIIFLIIVPFLTALIYLIARGGGMAQRQQAAAEAAQLQANAFIRNAAASSPADEIAKAKSLLDAGTISQAEFDALKAQITK
ncbi:MAG: SHOCT domain-containing protein [Microbacteriaceae bacterium]